ncbi:Uncharacterised protein [Mycobacteroides abscessus subsp. massiliense]|nr:Uncharacterised protein [Mycobacteroides abscessus subsp. massiliense]
MKCPVLQCAFDGLMHIPGLQPIFLGVFRRVIHRAVNVLAGSLAPFLVYLGARPEGTVTVEKDRPRGPPPHLRPRPGNGAQHSATEIHHIEAPPIFPDQGIGRNRMLTKVFP